MKKRNVRFGENFYKNILPTIVSLLTAALIISGAIFCTDWSQYNITQEHIVVLEEQAYLIQNTKNLVFPLNDYITSYSTNTTADEITVHLYGPNLADQLIVTYDNDFNLTSTKRVYTNKADPVIHILLFVFIFGALIGMFFGWATKKIATIIAYIINKIKSKKLKISIDDKCDEEFDSDFEF